MRLHRPRPGIVNASGWTCSRRIAEATDDEKDAYKARLKDLLNQADNLTADAIGDIANLVSDMQDDVVKRLLRTDPSKWSAVWLKSMLSSINDAAEKAADQYGNVLDGLLPKLMRVGADLTDTLTDAAGYPAVLPVITTHDLVVASRYKADLIRGYSEDATDAIGRYVARQVRTGAPPQETMRALALNIDTRGTPFRSVAYRAEAITRTEGSRVQNLGSKSRIQTFDQVAPEYDIKQRMMLSEGACEVCIALYESAPGGDGVWDADDDNAPDLPTDSHPNCFCKTIPWFPGLSKDRREITSKLEDVLSSGDDD